MQKQLKKIEIMKRNNKEIVANCLHSLKELTGLNLVAHYNEYYGYTVYVADKNGFIDYVPFGLDGLRSYKLNVLADILISVERTIRDIKEGRIAIK